MSRDVVIRAEGLGKKYVIGHQAERERYVALRDVIMRNARNLGRTAMDVACGRANVVGDEVEEFWALEDVNFEISRGEVVGVIGRNGAGKSTLLKVLSRITEPTAGRVEIRGRVASLLEVGAGVHPELTGRENIFLNGAVLGMSQAEIRRKFDEIVAFADVEKFLDTPVKRYSSGMYVRLGFAVAAHLEPEILIVDEVLAVGDAEFQKKCLGKMGEVAGQGRTVLFVSHNMAAIQALCDRGIVLAGGSCDFDGAIRPAIAHYQAQPTKRQASDLRISPSLRVVEVKVEPEAIRPGDPLKITAKLHASRPERVLELAFILCAADGRRVGIIDFREFGTAPCDVATGATDISLTLSRLPLVEGTYSVGLYAQTPHSTEDLPELADLSVSAPTVRADIVPVAPEWRGVVELAALEPSLSLEPSPLITAV